MRRYSQVAVWCVILASAVLGQSDRYPPGPMKGAVIAHPERLAGLWETEEGAGGAVGLQIELGTKVESTAKLLAGAPQYQETFSFAVYRRRGADREQNWFVDSPASGVTWDGTHLVLNFAGGSDMPRIDLDLTFNPDKATWTGRFRRDAFSREVTLRRPGAGAKTSAFVGTWTASGIFQGRCLHVAQAADGQLLGWADMLIFPEHIRYANGLQRPAHQYESYGDLAKVTNVGNTVEFVFNLSGICCSHAYAGKLSADGSTIEGAWVAGPNQAPGAMAWKRVQGESCVQDAPAQ